MVGQNYPQILSTWFVHAPNPKFKQYNLYKPTNLLILAFGHAQGYNFLVHKSTEIDSCRTDDNYQRVLFDILPLLAFCIL